ncbi:MAG: ABC transporter permease [Bryobacteraceae bacterium]
MNWIRLRAIARKELLHIVRDARSLALALALPLVMLVLFGYALSLDVDRISTIVLDRDQTPQSRDLIQQLAGSNYFEVRGYAANYAETEKCINQSKCLMAVIVSEQFGADLLAGREAQVQVLLDGSDSNTATIAQAYVNGLMANYQLTLRNAAQMQRGGGKMRPAVDARVRVWYNTDLKSRNYIVPGLIAVIIMIIAALLTSLTIAREWENGTMEQLLSTPARPAEIVLGKLSAFFLVGVFDMAVCLIIGIFFFDVPMRGNTFLLLFTCFVFLFGALCWGVFLSAATRNQLVAYQMGTLTSFLPAFLLSGFLYSVENMPIPIQLISAVVPARYFISAMKGIFLKGIGLRLLWFEITLLIVYGGLVFIAATRKMRQKIA